MRVNTASRGEYIDSGASSSTSISATVVPSYPEGTTVDGVTQDPHFKSGKYGLKMMHVTMWKTKIARHLIMSVWYHRYGRINLPPLRLTQSDG
jgi:hypothetical protein